VFHRHFAGRRFFAAGYGYGYGYSCWQWRWTPVGYRHIRVCGYPYGSYYY
jgi:hypothetical protein